ncbi:hypothetical protein Taro_030208 [Colocasia esculenta]|uniref:IBH1-like N-terminal domain-containing protein n=1 Tax=Colocasia esculenta TaxID=4460 RepID=A0A843VRB2_COLES|nr:hypothetical protein [Colocasia esculenta]
MQPTASFKLAFLRHMLAGIRLAGGVSSAPGMSVLERKWAIKSAADIAMAFARGSRTGWSRALVADLSGQERNRALARSILGREQFERLSRPAHPPECSLLSGSKKILRRSSCRVRSRIRKRPPAPRRATSASLLAKRMVRKRTQVLRRLVPGGKALEDDASLLEETLDYVVFLRAQVDLMQHLTNALLEPSKCRYQY